MYYEINKKEESNYAMLLVIMKIIYKTKKKSKKLKTHRVIMKIINLYKILSSSPLKSTRLNQEPYRCGTAMKLVPIPM